ncbi:MAG: molybdopterin-synthase adenylyltransferase MoeB [Acidobacteriota bacterium]|nr:molybdopterin-synthase adenylyltransferase MoeB [Acidobacteriota bacterium]
MSRRAGLSPDERIRYARQLALPGVGEEGQERLKAARVLVVGAGGLGSPVALYLAAAGVGTLGLVDFDAVDVTNLQRQVLYGTGDVGRPKLEAAAERLQGLNPGVRVVPHALYLSSGNALDILAAYDVIADGTDNFPARYLVNDACVLLGKPNVHASVSRFDGQASVFWAAKGPCYRCLFEEPPPADLVPSCAEGGVLGVLPGLLGTIQATEVLKLLLDVGEPLIGRLLLVDALRMETRTIRVPKNPACAICGSTPSVKSLVDYEAFCAGRPAASFAETSPAELAGRLASGGGGDVPFLLDVREPFEIPARALAGALNIPLAALPSRLDDVPRARDVVVYCESGVRSARALAILQAVGHARARHLAGGIARWQREGRPVVSSR